MIKSLMTAVFGTRFDRERKRIQPVVDQIHAAEERLKALSESELKAQTQKFRDRLAERTGAVKAELDAWHRAREIPDLARVIVFARPGSAVPASPLIAGVIDVPAIDISATEIRRRVRDGLPIRYWVPDPVAGYISRHRLYLDPA